jgi:hypothetical protein
MACAALVTSLPNGLIFPPVEENHSSPNGQTTGTKKPPHWVAHRGACLAASLFPESFTYLSFFLYIGEFQKPVFLYYSSSCAFCRVENFVKKNPPEKRQNVHPYSFTSFNFAASSNH